MERVGAIAAGVSAGRGARPECRSASAIRGPARLGGRPGAVPGQLEQVAMDRVEPVMAAQLAADPAEQGAKGVVVRDVLDEVQHHRRRQSGHPRRASHPRRRSSARTTTRDRCPEITSGRSETATRGSVGDPKRNRDRQGAEQVR